MDVALHELPVVFILDRAGVTGPDGASHHGVFDLAHLRTVPGLAIAAPSTADELCGVLETALEMNGPVVIRIPKGDVPAVPRLPAPAVPLGEWEELQHGSDVLLLASGRMVEPATKAATLLEEQGLSCGVVNARWIRPLDPRLVEWAGQYDRLVTVEDTVVAGGFGSAVLERLAEHGLAGKVQILGLPVEFLPFGDPSSILSSYGLDAEGIAASIAT
jgi:1-deoxy-D-xylulose-5-phosphate synthase